MSRQARRRPPPPWHPFPLAELLVLVGLACAAGALATLGSERALWLAAAAFTAALSAGLELAVREHLSGYRDHSASLAGAMAGALLGVGAWLRVAPFALLVAAVVAFAAAAGMLRLAYRVRRRRQVG